MDDKQNTTYEHYPLWIIFISTILQLSIIIIGSYLIYQIGIIWLLLYLIFLGILEIRLLRKSCIDCYYYGKRCAFGKGKLCSILFKKGNPNKFITHQIKWIDIVPDFLVSLIPMIIGIFLVLTDFDWSVVVLIVVLFFLGFVGTGTVRGYLACKFCKQKEIGCPADQLFNKPKKKKS